ncbi:putative oxidoreductase [Saccharicrinis carchari]|uniref:Putative oxidoreductase n=1 Tax=Saccharicrinis carchari TaxID=1168039 RepID=A0A521DFV9_SACCC|nr:DoxX family protein [Saccharicrinis carchari]SMO70475.1 putative oxidoreductase [Saccharicrinis carchari]
MTRLLHKILYTAGYPIAISVALLLLRISVGLLMLTHGYSKFLLLLGDEPIQFADPIGIGVTASLALTVFAEFFCSILLMLGIATRLSAIPLLITMLVAAFVFHAQDPFARQELPLLYATIYLAIIIVGAGKYSVDNWISKKIG